MVTASRVLQELQRPHRHQGKQLKDASTSESQNGTLTSSMTEATLFDDLPLNYGECLVLETYLHCKRGHYDRTRQEELSRPRQAKAVFDSWGIGVGQGESSSTAESTKSLNKSQVDNLVSRLTAPKKNKAALAAGESIALQASQKDNSKERLKTAADVEETFRRLAAPKPPKLSEPSPGEKVCLMYNSFQPGRTVDFQRLYDMAKPKKRGGSARSWGVYPSQPHTAREHRPFELPQDTLVQQTEPVFHESNTAARLPSIPDFRPWSAGGSQENLRPVSPQEEIASHATPEAKPCNNDLGPHYGNWNSSNTIQEQTQFWSPEMLDEEFEDLLRNSSLEDPITAADVIHSPSRDIDRGPTVSLPTIRPYLQNDSPEDEEADDSDDGSTPFFPKMR
jgi:hypothetical protein